MLFSVNVYAETVVPVLMYHNINDNYDMSNSAVEMSRDEFYSQMLALKNAGYTSITFSDYIKFEKEGTALPDKPVIITFDDGYLNNYTTAYPMLKELNMKATIFVVTGSMGMQNGVKYPHFTWEQAKEMENSGVIDIESHTNFHNNLTSVSDNTLITELRKSRYLINKFVGKEPTVVAYPYGANDERVRKFASEAGYDAAVMVRTENPGVNRKGDDIYALKRITVYGGMDGNRLIKSIKENEEL
jgi:peptidoglycan/xylan/chitin deacetylase (PgdA/CDA1 family)